jgi:hypothetical protein
MGAGGGPLPTVLRFSGRGDCDRILLAAPLLLAVQTPLWIAKCWLRWRITQSGNPFQERPTRSIGIRDLMIGTGMIAACLALAKYASDSEGVRISIAVGAVRSILAR